MCSSCDRQLWRQQLADIRKRRAEIRRWLSDSVDRSRLQQVRPAHQAHELQQSLVHSAQWTFTEHFLQGRQWGWRHSNKGERSTSHFVISEGVFISGITTVWISSAMKTHQQGCERPEGHRGVREMLSLDLKGAGRIRGITARMGSSKTNTVLHYCLGSDQRGERQSG